MVMPYVMMLKNIMDLLLVLVDGVKAIARKDNYCEIDPTTVDQFGIPVLKFNYKWSDLEIKQAKHMQDTFEEIIHNMGGEPLGDKPGKDRIMGLITPGNNHS